MAPPRPPSQPTRLYHELPDASILSLVFAFLRNLISPHIRPKLADWPIDQASPGSSFLLALSSYLLSCALISPQKPCIPPAVYAWDLHRTLKGGKEREEKRYTIFEILIAVLARATLTTFPEVSFPSLDSVVVYSTIQRLVA